jgi:hypothetical protein
MNKTMRRLPSKTTRFFQIALVIVLSLALISAASGFRVLRANMTGAAEIPGPGDADGSGIARIRLFPNDSSTSLVCFGIKVEDILLPAIGAHIHVGAADVAGPVVVALTPPDGSGQSEGCVVADKALADAIYNDPSAYYVNVHTTDFPAGAVRGQLTK